MSHAYEHILLDVSEGIATITLNRPEKLNAFTDVMLRDLLAAFDETDARDDVRAVIVTGAGRAFCAGADLSGGAKTFDHSSAEGPVGVRERDGGGIVSLRMFRSLKPVIAAVNGPAAGVGVTMQLPMDVRLASEAAKYGLVFARRGIVPEAASSWFLPRLVGISQALEWCYSGRVFPASEAHAAGLVRAIYAPDDLIPAARKLAHDMTAHSAAVSIALTRQMMWRMLGAEHPMRAHQADSRAMKSRGASEDAKEGVMSFLEKREAVYPCKVSDGLPDIFPFSPAPDWA